ncbi:MAG: bifunctional phosphoribosylaminoimidazolecarboxamide formyltransferase/IMP cyclohydrolase [Candidatus Aureabacteria bacterium]|nr:bifunctional phosphoribosylaminoimidazolecarboxamide formyltransferase/IMP cyclohydrolase [Candidatus Auribacterota bacterium]
MRPARCALISVHDKRGTVEFARGLSALGVKIVSTGGTARHLSAAGIQVVEVAALTGFPETLEGRVKTLHPRIHAGILASRESEAHRLQMQRMGWDYIDIVAVNLPSPDMKGDDPDQFLKGMDIGGPALLRSAAKNCRDVIAISNPARYSLVLGELQAGGNTVSDGLRLRLAREAIEATAAYDAVCHRRLTGFVAPAASGLPPELELHLDKIDDLRYGENPHQRAAIYRRLECGEPSVVGGALLHGKPLSYNNYVDLDAALEIVKEFRTPACAIIKHSNPCGVARGAGAGAAFTRALETDPESAFGGIVGFNCPVGEDAAVALASTFFECVIAPSFDEGALSVLGEKKNLRIVELPAFTEWLSCGAERERGHELRSIVGGVLLQERDLGSIGLGDLKHVTRATPVAADAGAIFFAWTVVRHVRSNAVVIADAEGTVGIGAGQMSRVDAARIAVAKVRKPLKGCVAVSDGFFPFRDAVDELARAGVRLIVQPGGSKMDEAIIAACDELGVAMVFTGMRCFKH